MSIFGLNKVGKCRVCGCTNDNPCFHPDHGFCWWADEAETICSHCACEEIANDPETVHCVNTKNVEVDDTVDEAHTIMFEEVVEQIRKEKNHV